jgi:hypothetical protein
MDRFLLRLVPPLPFWERGGQHPCSERDGPLPAAACSPAPILGEGERGNGASQCLKPHLRPHVLSAPAPILGEGVSGRGETALRNAPNRISTRPFCPPLKQTGAGTGAGWRGCFFRARGWGKSRGAALSTVRRLACSEYQAANNHFFSSSNPIASATM